MMPRDIAQVLRWTLIVTGAALVVFGLFALGAGKQHAMMRSDFGYALFVGLACSGVGITMLCLSASNGLQSAADYLAGCWLRWTSRARS